MGRGASTREAIAGAARRLFAERGFAGTSVRDIAAEAGVDAALVIRHSGSKEDLFLSTMRIELPTTPVDGPVDELGEGIVRYVLDAGDEVRAVYLALLRASDSAGVGSRLRHAHEEYFVGRLRARLEGADADLRARLAAAAVGGLLYSLWVVEDEPLRSTGHDELVHRYGAMLQSVIDGR
ncbi:MAG TPA: TetR family transcriptional regulator [Rhodoglobus sp.]|nr:TetR family transcriptional regulator [Rhodoglobus sp.]